MTDSYFPPLRSALKQSSSRPSTPGTGAPSIASTPPASIAPLPLASSATAPSISLASATTSSSSSVSMSSPLVSQSHSPAPFSPISASSTVSPPIAHLPGTPVYSSGYKPKVSFDTFENPAASMFSFTLHVESDGYARTKDTRTYLCASSADETGRGALDWAIENLVQEGDELIVFRGFDADVLERDHEAIREEARQSMARLQKRCVEMTPSLKLSITVEFIAGKITQTIDRLIALYRPDSVVVSSHGPRGMIQAVSSRFGAPAIGGLSKYCLTHSPVPVIVVRPEAKVRKTLDKRRANPKRGTHFDDGSLRLHTQQTRGSLTPSTATRSPNEDR